MSTQVEKIKVPKPLAVTVTASQAAELHGVHRATIYRWMTRGIFPAPTVKKGRTVRWSRAEVETWSCPAEIV